MITANDAIMALSNSGETAELSDIVAYAKLKRIPLVSVTGKADSALSNAADVPLVMPDSPEACPLNLAPTTSTTSCASVMRGSGRTRASRSLSTSTWACRNRVAQAC